MDAPDWRTFKSGARIRVALWLHSEVGVGGVFTKSDLRNAFPGVEQIDRRMRDLRTDGWVISTYREDRSLEVDELRLVDEGGIVWDPNYRLKQRRKVTNRERHAIMRSDNYMCVACGIAVGEAFPDDPLRMAKLSVVERAGEVGPATALSTLCDRCLAGGGDEQPEDLVAEIGSLTGEQRVRLMEWIRCRSRIYTREEELWGRYRRLPATSKAVVEQHLEVEEAKSWSDEDV